MKTVGKDFIIRMYETAILFKEYQQQLHICSNLKRQVILLILICFYHDF